MHWSVIARVVADSVNASPSANGLPGAGFVQRLIDWTAQVGLWGSLAAMLIGAAMFGMSQQVGNYLGASAGNTSCSVARSAPRSPGSRPASST